MPSREELWELLQKNGASTRDSMSKKVNLLLVGEGYGQTKINHARKHGCPTLSLPMAEYLGFFDERGSVFNLDPQIKDLLPELTVNHSFICDVLYGHFIRLHGQSDPRSTTYLGAFYQLAAGLSELLRIAWGDPDGDDPSAPADLINLLQSLEEIRTEAEAGIHSNG